MLRSLKILLNNFFDISFETHLKRFRELDINFISNGDHFEIVLKSFSNSVWSVLGNDAHESNVSAQSRSRSRRVSLGGACEQQRRQLGWSDRMVKGAKATRLGRDEHCCGGRGTAATPRSSYITLSHEGARARDWGGSALCPIKTTRHVCSHAEHGIHGVWLRRCHFAAPLHSVLHAAHRIAVAQAQQHELHSVTG